MVTGTFQNGMIDYHLFRKCMISGSSTRTELEYEISNKIVSWAEVLWVEISNPFQEGFKQKLNTFISIKRSMSERFSQQLSPRINFERIFHFQMKNTRANFAMQIRSTPKFPGALKLKLILIPFLSGIRPRANIFLSHLTTVPTSTVQSTVKGKNWKKCSNDTLDWARRRSSDRYPLRWVHPYLNHVTP